MHTSYNKNTTKYYCLEKDANGNLKIENNFLGGKYV